MKLKKVFAGLVLFGATLTLVACGSNSSTKESSSEASSSKVAESSSSEAMATELKDGKYMGESDYDERGWKVVDTIEVKDGKIVSSDFGYENKDGKRKADDEEYNTNMKAKSGVSSKEATDKLNAQLIETQDVDSVEVVSGASHTSANFTIATKALLEAAAAGNTEKVMFDLGE
ncbi:FMN-binding domain-containing protein [Streptococcus sp. X16XC17]|uniref:FMN-binding protein n=1 Tax=unclassified Streptococcus TaxID=2608887 RepID=UPI00066FC6DC|nr:MULTISPECIES: hypothetical protein [unclassified Streptococcus]TCD46238.1 FMN-binding domain-containing protein [Streptococcus sp. X16XC17]